jgi:hypothetical protein
MAKLFDKFLVQRRDGTVPDWPYLVIGARDPAAPAALRAYADEAAEVGMSAEYRADIRRLADSFEEYMSEHGQGDPDAPAHRPDDPAVVAQIKAGSTPDGWKERS